MGALEKQLGIDLDLYAAFVIWGLIFTRTFVMLILTPFLTGRGAPGRYRMLLAVLLATYVFFLIEDGHTVLPESRGLIIALYLKEIFFGLALGMTTILCFYALEAAGRIVDNQRGSANAQIFVPQLGQVSIFGLFQYWYAIALFLALSGHTVFLDAFLTSFIKVPILQFPEIDPGVSPFMTFMVRMSADVLIWGMQLAAPVLIAIFLTDIVLGLANKMAPQIPVFELGFMLKGYLGVVMVFVAALVMADQMKVFFRMMNANVVKLVEIFSQ